MALETKPAKDPAAEDKHELDPKRKAALDTALARRPTQGPHRGDLRPRIIR